METKYYQEKCGDYLAFYGQEHVSSGERMLEVRAAAIEGLSSSVQATSMSIKYRKTCRRVKFSDIPEKWAKMF